MNRLTHRLKTGEVLMATEYEEKYTMDEWICVLQERLAAYEDTGLTPAEVMAMRHTLDEYHKVADTFLKAQADDRVVVLPCKDWLNRSFCEQTHSADDADCVSCYEGLRTLFLTGSVENEQAWKFDPNAFGKTGFYAREEAKKALEVKDG